MPGLRTASDCRRAYRTARRSLRECSTADIGEPEEELALTDNIDIRDDGPMIVATVLVPGCTPDRALAAFTDRAMVSQWWRGDLKTEPVEGGPYTVDFPAIPAQLTGEVLTLEPGKVEFTWSWDDELPDSTVLITAGPAAASRNSSAANTHPRPTRRRGSRQDRAPGALGRLGVLLAKAG